MENLRDLVRSWRACSACCCRPWASSFGFLTRRVSNRGALLGFILGSACGLAAYALSLLPAESSVVMHVSSLFPRSVLAMYPEGTGLAFLNTVPGSPDHCVAHPVRGVWP